MAVFRIEKTRDYTVMSNHHLRNTDLSLKAKGLLSLMLSLPEDWDYTMKGLARICKDGIDSISGGIRELEAHGYLIRERIRNENGQLGSIEYTILEQPKPPVPMQGAPILENPIQAVPTLDTPMQGDPAQLNTKGSSNQISKKDLSSTEASNPKPIKSTLSKALDYIQNPDKTDGKMLVSSFGCSYETADIEFGFTLAQAIEKGNNLAHHLIQSFEPGEVDYEKAHEIGKQLADAVTKGQHEYVLTTHIDKGHMSRFGRDYLQVGMYTEIMFPEHDIHFIAVNDGVDSTQGDNEFTPFRNIINEWYAKDTSKKIRAVMKVKGNAGEHLTTMPPYGYMKSPDDKKQWVKDEEAAQVVYEIGLYVMDGFGPSQIARKLTERKILTPAAYYESKGRTTNVSKKGSPYAWDSSTIADIMDRWREYLGHTVNFKTRKKSYKSKKTLLNPETEWKIFENTHEAIWTEAIADAVRLARQTRRRPTKMGEMGMFSGMMFCADCGSIMYQCRATNFRRDQEYYLCSGYRKSRDICGQTHSIRTVILEELVLQNLREIVSFASQRKDDFVKMVMDADMRQRNRGLVKRKKTLDDAEKRIAELDSIFKRLYEDTISGKLSDERFQKLSTDYEKEQHQLQELAVALRGEIEAEERKSANVERFLSVVERYTEIPELTPSILHEFVEKIVVHAASDPKGKNRTQEIDIYYKGIGALEVSKVTSSRQE